jgi:hypothetical protein
MSENGGEKVLVNGGQGTGGQGYNRRESGFKFLSFLQAVTPAFDGEQ